MADTSTVNDTLAPDWLLPELCNIALAKSKGKDAQLKALANAARIAAPYVRRGLIQRPDVVDRLVAEGTNVGLCKDPGQAVVERTIGDALNAALAELERATASQQASGRMPVSDIVTEIYKRHEPKDNVVELHPQHKEEQPRATLVAMPYSWRDPATIPPRQFLYDRHYVRKAIGATVGGGGRAKTTLGTVEFISMAVGRNPLTGEAIKPLRIWYINGEEDQDELDRRFAATLQYHHVTEADCGGRLFVQSVRDKPMRLATIISGKNAAILNRPALDQFEAEIRDKQVDIFGLDPWVSFHSVNESSNEHMDLLIKEGLGGIANRTNAAGEIFHHPGKPKPGQAETVVEDARGASAIIWAVRSARVLNFMTTEQANKLGIAENDRRMHIRVANGKANMGPIGKATWFKLQVENLANGDEIVCAGSWKPPNPFQGITEADMHNCRKLAQTGTYRADSRAKEWFGYAVADMLKINIKYGSDNDPADIARMKQILETWQKNKVITVETRKDKDRRDHDFIVPGKWKPEPNPDPDPDPDLMIQ